MTDPCRRCPLSTSNRARRRLRALLDGSGLTARELARAIGVAPRTIERHLAPGAAISRARAEWYQAVERIEYVGNRVQLTISLGITRRRWNYRLHLLPIAWRPRAVLVDQPRSDSAAGRPRRGVLNFWIRKGMMRRRRGFVR